MTWLRFLLGAFPADLAAPADYPTIQDAINAAVNNDVVQVSPGTYAESLDFLGKRITVRSTDGPAVTMIDGSSFDGPLVVFQNNERNNSVLEGFRLQGGDGYDEGGLTYGGAIFMDTTSPSIVGNVFVDNVAHYGGAIACRSFSPLARSPRLIDNEFLDNVARWYGGAVSVVQLSPHLSGNRFEGNRARLAGFGDGGALFCDRCPSVTIDHCQFIQNKGLNGGGMYADDCGAITIDTCTFDENEANHDGGGTHLTRCLTIDIASCVFSHNLSAFGIGGGLLLEEDVEAAVRDTLFAHNSAIEGSGLAGLGGRARPLDLVNCEFFANDSVRDHPSVGAGALFSNLNVHASQCTFAKNTSDDPGSAILMSYSDVDLSECILWGNENEDISTFGNSHLTADWSDVEGGQSTIYVWSDSPTIDWGPNNIDVDPLFVDAASGDLRLQENSPCVDAGRPDFLPSGRDRKGVPRLLDGGDDRQMIVDLGAHEYTRVTLAVTDQWTPGGTVTITTKGVPGQQSFLWYGLLAGETLVAPFGSTFFSFAGVWGVLPWPSAPASIDVVLPVTIPTPLPLVLQSLAIDPVSGAGTFSNPAEVVVE